MPKRTELDTVYLVGTIADCENDFCQAYDSVEVFASEQTAKQFADSAWGARYLGPTKVYTKKPY